MDRTLLSGLRLVVFDIDGVFTDGTLLLDEDGRESKRFNTQDGYGVRRLIAAGIEVAVISGRQSGAVSSRMLELDIRHVFQGSRDKLKILKELADSLGIELAEIAFIGDDLPDLEVMQAVGLPVAVANAVPGIKQISAYVTAAKGGSGAVREFCDLLCDARSAS